jgi:hypothetical protein
MGAAAALPLAVRGKKISFFYLTNAKHHSRFLMIKLQKSNR